MSMNMMDLLKGQLGGMVAKQIAGKLGIDPNLLNSGIGAMLPTILGSLIKQASTPEGAQQLDETLNSDDFDGSMFDNVTDMFSGGNTDAMTDLGGGLVGSLFGDKAGMISELIGKATGMKSGASSGLLAMLVPIVMSFLGKQKRSLGLDSGGMANLLMSQKDEVAKAMPGGMASVLGLTDLGFEDTPAGAPAETPMAQPSVAPGATGSQEGASGLAKLIPIAVLAIAGFLGYKLMNQPAAPAVQDVGADITSAIDDINAGAQDVMTDASDTATGISDAAMGMLSGEAADLTTKLTDVFSSYKETLGAVEDADTAKAAVPEMEKLNEQLGGMTGMLDKLPGGVQETISAQVAGMVEPIRAMLDKVMAIPGVKPILQPVVDSMLEKVKAFS